MKAIEAYEMYKKKYESTLIIVKEGIFYHAYMRMVKYYGIFFIINI